MEQLTKASEEPFPTWTLFCLNNTSLIVASIMFLICCYILVVYLLHKLVEIVGGKFSFLFIILGLCITAGILYPTISFYLKYKDDPVNEDPYTVDPEHNVEVQQHMEMHLLMNEEELDSSNPADSFQQTDQNLEKKNTF